MNISLRHILLTAVVAVAASTPLQAVTVDSIVATIGANNLRIKAIDATAEATARELSTRNTLDAPTVEYSPFFRKGADGVASSELVVSQEFDFPTVYAARHRAARTGSAEARTAAAAERRDLLLDAKLKCLELVARQQQRALLERRDSIATELERLAERRLAEGATNRLEVNRVKMERMDVGIRLGETDAAIGRLVAELTALNGGAPLPLDRLEYPAIDLAALSDESVDRLADNDPTLLAARASVATATDEAKVSRQEWFPRLTVGYRRNTELGEASNGVLVGVALPIFSGSARVKAADARLLASRLQLEDAAVATRGELASNVAELRRLRSALSLYDLGLIDSSLALLRRAVELGNMTVVDYYTEADKIYSRLQDYQELENSCQQLAARLLRSRL